MRTKASPPARTTEAEKRPSRADGGDETDDEEWSCALSKGMRRRLKASGRSTPLSIRLPKSSSGGRIGDSRILLTLPDDSLSALKVKYSAALGNYPIRAGALVTRVLAVVKERIHGHPDGKSTTSNSILCLGLGNPAVDASSLRQLAFLSALVEASGGIFRPAKTFLYDPVLKATSRTFIRHQGFRVLSTNREGAYRLPRGEFALVFLPHCPLALAEGLLACNWDPATLNRVVFLTCPLKPRPGGDPVPHLASLQVHRHFGHQDIFQGERDFEGLRVEWFDVPPQLPAVAKSNNIKQVRAGGDLLPAEYIANFIDCGDAETTPELV